MPSLVLRPRAAPADRLRVWLGVFDAGAAPVDMVWSLDGAPTTAVPVRQLAAAHSHGSRSLTGVFELRPAAAAGAHRISVRAAGFSPSELVMRAVPGAVPDDDWLRILLTSCYHRDEDRGGLAGRTCRNLAAAWRPDLTLLMGDSCATT